MPRPHSLRYEDVLHYMQLRRNPASTSEIATGLQIPKKDIRALHKLLAKLIKRRAIEELPGQRYRVSERHGKSGSQPRREEREEGKRARTAEPSRQFSQSSSAGGQSVAPRDAVSGRLVLHQDGYGFVVPDTPPPQIEGDIFIPRDAIEDAMHGDRVLARISRRSGVAGGMRAEGRILRIVGRAHPTVVGQFRYGPRGNFVLPYDIRIQQEIEIPPGDELTAALRQKLGLPVAEPGGKPAHARRGERLPELDGAVVNVEILRYPRGGGAATGRVLEIVGRPGDLGVDTEIIIRKHHLPHHFDGSVLADAENRAHPVGEDERQGREDFRDLPIVTIDGETARDFDDAVYVERRPGGGWHLAVHIADVSHYVRVDAALDREARLRGTSVYFPDRAVPMLPEQLSSGICSLVPHEERLVMSALMEFDAAGRMHDARFVPGVIRSAARMTYTNVNKVLEGDPEMSAVYAGLAARFRDMRELALLLNARRAEHGSIDFDLPEPVIEFDEEQRMIAISRSERNIAHRLIEEFMLAANRAVAGYLEKRGIPSLHRVHEKPDARKVLEFEELARAFGYSLGVENLHERSLAVRHGSVPAPARQGRPDSFGHGRERPMRVALPGAVDLRITPLHYQRLVKKLSGTTEERIMSYLMLRSLKQARYAADPLGHFALGFDEYTHFTSPIRRYPDLIVHRILKWALENPNAQPSAHRAAHAAREAEAMSYSRGQLEETAAESSEAERRAVGAERELMSWKRAQFMEDHLGDEYEALIISVQKYGCFVELFEVFVEGLLPMAALEEAADGRCVYREHDHAIIALGPSERGGAHGRRGGRKSAAGGGKAWRLGDRVRVRAERVDPMRRRVEFSIAAPEQTPE